MTPSLALAAKLFLHAHPLGSTAPPLDASASSAIVPAPSMGMRYGLTYSFNTNPNARQPGTFNTSRN